MGWRPFKGEATPPMPLPTLSLSLSSRSHSRVPSYTHYTHGHGHGHHARMPSNDHSKRDADELRKANAEYQTQLTKARSLRGQVRVEKDMLAEKLVESDRDGLRAQV